MGSWRASETSHVEEVIVSDPDRERPRSDDLRAVETLEQIAPWIVFGMVVAIVILLALSAILGVAW